MYEGHTSAEGTEVLSGLGHSISEELSVDVSNKLKGMRANEYLECDAASSSAIDGDIEEDLGVRHDC